MSYPAVLFEYGANHDKIITIDIRENSGAILKTDFLTEQIPAQYDLIITNPPFDKAKEFIEKSITHLAP
jgi:16S rRNA G1207 methylase RsmC